MAYPTKKYWLVVSPPLKDIWTNKNCSKPQTRIGYHPIKNCDFPVTLVYQRVHIPIFPNISYIMGLKTSKHFTKTIYPNISQYIPIYPNISIISLSCPTISSDFLSFPHHFIPFFSMAFTLQDVARCSPRGWDLPAGSSPRACAPHLPGMQRSKEKAGVFLMIWGCVKTLYPCSSHQNSW